MLVEEQVFTPREFSILFDLHAAISCHQKFRVWYYFFTLLLRQWKLEESAVQVLIRPGNCNFKVVHFIFRACSFFYCASQQLSPLCYFNDNVQTATPRSSATHLTSSPSIQEQSILTILWSSLAFSWPCVRLFATMCDKLTTLLVTPFRIFWLLYDSKATFFNALLRKKSVIVPIHGFFC